MFNDPANALTANECDAVQSHKIAANGAARIARDKPAAA
jgi:hypothetical protein